MNRIRRVCTSYGVALALPFLLVPAAVWSGGRANADTGTDKYVAVKGEIVCEWFDDYPSASSVAPMFKAIMADTGFTIDQTAEVMVTSVAVLCPEWLPLLKRYADSASPTATFKTSAVVGGRTA